MAYPGTTNIETHTIVRVPDNRLLMRRWKNVDFDGVVYGQEHWEVTLHQILYGTDAAEPTASALRQIRGCFGIDQDVINETMVLKKVAEFGSAGSNNIKTHIFEAHFRKSFRFSSVSNWEIIAMPYQDIIDMLLEDSILLKASTKDAFNIFDAMGSSAGG